SSLVSPSTISSVELLLQAARETSGRPATASASSLRWASSVAGSGSAGTSACPVGGAVADPAAFAGRGAACAGPVPAGGGTGRASPAPVPAGGAAATGAAAGASSAGAGTTNPSAKYSATPTSSATSQPASVRSLA